MPTLISTAILFSRHAGWEQKCPERQEGAGAPSLALPCPTAAPKLPQPSPCPSGSGSRAFPETFPSAASPKAGESGLLPLPPVPVPVPGGLCRYHWHQRWLWVHVQGVSRSFLYSRAKPMGRSREGLPAGRDATDAMDWGQAHCRRRRQPRDRGDRVTDGEKRVGGDLVSPWGLLAHTGSLLL